MPLPGSLRKVTSAAICAVLKKNYSAHKKTLVQTGGGLKPENQQNKPHRYMRDFTNAILAEILAEKIKLAFPHWDQLDGFWRELLNYNPIGVSNATGGVDHAAAAASLFRKKADSGDTSGIDVK
ncbi:hypothetical protein B0H14DRAFT_3489163 [Mycena olivaceomarginata]|nr:hypothetical protein B0H14DRAFT_3489163 [Mycena olivaceomarginata]